MWRPIGNATTVPAAIGMPAFTTTGFTATTRAITATNYFTRKRRLGFVTAATAGSVGHFRIAASQFTLGAAGTTAGGFVYKIQFGESSASLIDGRIAMGVRTNLTPTNVAPATLTQFIGLGHDDFGLNMNLYYGGTSAQTPIDLGGFFPVPAIGGYNTDFYELEITALPNTNDVGIKVTRLNTGHVFQTTLTRTSAAVLPSETQLLMPWGFLTNHTSAAAAGVDVAAVAIEHF